MLILNTALVLVHPLPDTLEEGRAANRVTVGSLLGQQSLDHRLRSNPGVIFTWHPQGIVTFHAVVANKYILDSGSNGVTQVQRTGHIGWRHADDKRRTSCIATRLEVAALPETVPFALDGLRLVGFR